MAPAKPVANQALYSALVPPCRILETNVTDPDRRGHGSLLITSLKPWTPRGLWRNSLVRVLVAQRHRNNGGLGTNQVDGMPIWFWIIRNRSFPRNIDTQVIQTLEHWKISQIIIGQGEAPATTGRSYSQSLFSPMPKNQTYSPLIDTAFTSELVG